MKFDSKYFDRIRIRSRREDGAPKPQAPCCDWEGCDEPGLYRAPKGNRAVGEYHNFCLEHVRHYNHVFNFFAGMKPDEMDAHLRREQETDGRPSWGFGASAADGGPRMPRGFTNATGRRKADPLHVFARYRRAQARGPQPEPVRPLHEPDRRALEVLGVAGHVRAEEIKVAYKRLVKIHHPDANGGDRASEERLRGIIAAYTHLKARGFVKA
jgi:DnaJ-domain-containing protein 1